MPLTGRKQLQSLFIPELRVVHCQHIESYGLLCKLACTLDCNVDAELVSTVV